MRSLISKIVLACLIFWCVERFCHHKTDGFQVTHVYSSSFDEELSCARTDVEVLLSQPFSYLGSGGQTYAFVSADGKTVLKLFKHHHLKNPHKRALFFQSCKLAYQELQDETALLYLKLHRTSYFKKPLILIDKLGIQHILDPNLLQFALQKKVSLASPLIKKLVRSGKKEEAKKVVSAVIEHLRARCRKGIKDRDSGTRRNIGYLEGKAVSIDIGSFTKVPSLHEKEKMQHEVQKKTKRMAHTLEYYDLELWQYYQRELEAL